ncbi:MAG: hypothetical protein Q4C63_05395 [Eubacteriales bacterium]|nr:hypothetical protein [Eubacteriales bacterium]
MRKICYLILDILTAAFLCGGYITNYFTRRKLGMLRWINYHTMNYQKQLPLDVLKYAAAAAASVIVILILLQLFRKWRRLGICDKIMAAVMTAVWLLYLGLSILSGQNVMRAYYFVLPLAGLALLTQIIRNLLSLHFLKVKPKSKP